MHSGIPRQTLKDPINWLSWGLGTGLSPYMPGTCGSFAGVGLYLCLSFMPVLYYIGLTAALFVAGIWLCHYTARSLEVNDHRSIVWDEIVGILICLTAVPAGWYWILYGFLLFRLFDIWKPWPANWLDRYTKGGAGIMADDGVAAVYAWIVIQVTSNLSGG